MRLLRCACASVCLLLGAASADAQGVRGRVLDGETGREVTVPISVQLLNERGQVVAETSTGDRGTFRLLAQVTGVYTLRASGIGFQETNTQIDLRTREELTVELRIAAAAIALDPLTVTARVRDPRGDPTREGMLARHALYPPAGSRRVMLAESDEMLSSTTISELLQWIPRSPRQAACTILYWDGRVVDNAELAEEWLAEPMVQYLDAVEVYRRQSEAPQTFQTKPLYLIESAADCTVVVMWPGDGYRRPTRFVEPYRMRLNAGPGARLVSGTHAPEAGVAGEALFEWQVQRHVLVGLFASRSRSNIAAATLDALAAPLGHGAEQLGARSMTISTAGLQVAWEPWPAREIRPVVAARVLTANRSFNPFRDERAAGQQSSGRGVGVSVGAERTLGRGFMLRAMASHDRVSFDAFGGLERPGSPTTEATWGVSTLRVEFGYLLVR